MKSGKYRIGVPVVVFAALFAVFAYYMSYPIELNHTTLPEVIRLQYNRGTSRTEGPYVDVYNGVQLGDRVYYLMEIDHDHLGYICLKEGMFGRYKFRQMGYGNGNFREGIVEADGQKYWLFGGRDVTEQIALVSMELEGKVYELPVANRKDRFLLHTELDYDGEGQHIGREHIRLYNEAGEDITDRYDLSGGGIY